MADANFSSFDVCSMASAIQVADVNFLASMSAGNADTNSTHCNASGNLPWMILAFKGYECVIASL